MPGPEQLSREQPEDRAEAQVREQVADVEVQRQRGDRAPRFASARRRRDQRARIEPVALQRKDAGKVADADDQRRVDERAGPRAAMQRLVGDGPAARGILAFVHVELRECLGVCGRRHQQHPGPAEPDHLRVDADGVQHEAALLALAAPERTEDLGGIRRCGRAHRRVDVWRIRRRAHGQGAARARRTPRAAAPSAPRARGRSRSPRGRGGSPSAGIPRDRDAAAGRPDPARAGCG